MVPDGLPGTIGAGAPSRKGAAGALQVTSFYRRQPDLRRAAVGRPHLPVLGGSASVWNSAMLTFQVLRWPAPIAHL
jgi:hypothetical protein